MLYCPPHQELFPFTRVRDHVPPPHWTSLGPAGPFLNFESPPPPFIVEPLHTISVVLRILKPLFRRKILLPRRLNSRVSFRTLVLPTGSDTLVEVSPSLYRERMNFLSFQGYS